MSKFTARDMYTSIRFDGVDDYVESASIPELSSFTYMAWAKSDGFRATANPIMGGSLTANYPFFQQAASGQVQLYDGKNARTIVSCTRVLWRHKDWIHLACTHDGNTGRTVVYVNGIPTEEATVTPLSTWGPAPIRVGRQGGAATYFGGCIDEPRVYGRVLSDAEIAQSVFDGNYPSDALVAFNFDEAILGTTVIQPAPGFPAAVAGTGFGSLAYSFETPLAAPLSGWDYTVEWRPDGVNDTVLRTGADVFPYLFGQRSLVMSCVYHKLVPLPASTNAIWFMPSGTGGTGISIGESSTIGGPSFSARSRDGGYVSYVESPAGSGYGRFKPSLWQHVVGVIEYDVPRISLYVNGLLQVVSTSITPEDASYQCGVINALVATANGGMGPVIRFARAGIYTGRPTKDDVRQWYLSQQSPASLRAVLDWRMDQWNGSVVTDLSGNGLNGTVTGTPALPFGIRPLVW